METGKLLTTADKKAHVLNLYHWARAYIKRGWVVIPCHLTLGPDQKKKPIFNCRWSEIDFSRFNLQQFRDLAMTNFRDIGWFSALYLLTRQSKVVVVDRDSEQGRQLIDVLGTSPIVSHTARGPTGSHAWFAGDDSISRYQNQPMGYDVPGGVFVAPSIVVDSDKVLGIYQWVEGITLGTIADIILPPVPYVLKRFLQATVPASRAYSDNKNTFKDWKPSREYILSLLNDESIGKGQRHTHILKIAGMMLKANQSREKIEEMLRHLCKKRGWWDKQKDIDGIIDWIIEKNKTDQPKTVFNPPTVTEPEPKPSTTDDDEVLSPEEFRRQLSEGLKSRENASNQRY